MGLTDTAAAFPNVYETIPSSSTLTEPFQVANIKFLAGCVVVFVPVKVTPSFEYPYGTTIDTLIVRDVSVPTNAYEVGVTDTDAAFPIIYATTPKSLTLTEPFQSANVKTPTDEPTNSENLSGAK